MAAPFHCAWGNYSEKSEEIILYRASTASFSSGPSAISLMGVPFTMPRDRTPSRLFALTFRSSFYTQIALLNSLAFWIKNVAGLACSPT